MGGPWQLQDLELVLLLEKLLRLKALLLAEQQRHLLQAQRFRAQQQPLPVDLAANLAWLSEQLVALQSALLRCNSVLAGLTATQPPRLPHIDRASMIMASASQQATEILRSR